MRKHCVSVIIPNKDNADKLKACLATFIEQSDDSIELDIIVVDNGSKDDSITVARQYNVRCIEVNDKPSPYLCRNIGVENAKGDYIMLLDSRCLPTQNLAQNLLNKICRDVDLVLPDIKFIYQKKIQAANYVDAFLFGDSEDLVESKISFSTRCFLCKRSVFDKIGLFKNVRSGDDTRWSKDFFSSGLNITYAPKAVVYYQAVEKKALLRKAKRFGTARKELLRKNKYCISNYKRLAHIKNLLPPNPALFLKRIKKKGFDLSLLELLNVYLCFWEFKALRAWTILT